jgi:charged multivesicular body protein 4
VAFGPKKKKVPMSIRAKPFGSKSSAAAPPQTAIVCIKRKKGLEAQIEQTGNARATVEQQMLALESATVNMETLSAMKAGAASLKSLQKGMTTDEVDVAMDDIRDAMDVNNEIGDAIARPFQDVDESELESELNELEQQNVEKQLLGAKESGIAASPAAAIAAPSPVKARHPTAEEETELAQLEAALAV